MSLEFITVKGWPVIVQKALGLKAGDRVVYFPPDSVMPPELAERLGITKYLALLPREIDGTRKPGLRVCAARLRGEPSYGTIDHQVDPSWEVGRDVKEHYGVTKFEPPERPNDGESLPGVAAFHRYTEIENIRNFPDVLRPGEEVVITEKIHGKTCRLGLVRVRRDDGALRVHGRLARPAAEGGRREGTPVRLLAADDRRRARAAATPERGASAASSSSASSMAAACRTWLTAWPTGPRASGRSTSPLTASTSTSTSQGRGAGAVRHRDGAAPLPGAVLVGSGRGAHLRPDDDVPARLRRAGSRGREGCVITPVTERYHAGSRRLGPGDPQVDLGRLPGPGGHRRALRSLFRGVRTLFRRVGATHRRSWLEVGGLHPPYDMGRIRGGYDRKERIMAVSPGVYGVRTRHGDTDPGIEDEANIADYLITGLARRDIVSSMPLMATPAGMLAGRDVGPRAPRLVAARAGRPDAAPTVPRAGPGDPGAPSDGPRPGPVPRARPRRRGRRLPLQAVRLRRAPGPCPRLDPPPRRPAGPGALAWRYLRGAGRTHRRAGRAARSTCPPRSWPC